MPNNLSLLSKAAGQNTEADRICNEAAAIFGMVESGSVCVDIREGLAALIQWAFQAIANAKRLAEMRCFDRGGNRVIRSERFFADSEDQAVQRLGLAVAALVFLGPRQVVEVGPCRS
jgi:hypothetical protein